MLSRLSFKKIVSFLLGVTLSILILFQTGLFHAVASNKANIISLVLLFVVVSVLYFLNLDYKKIIDDIKNKKIPKPSFAFVLFVVVELALLLSFIFNKNKSDNFPSYGNFMVLFAISVLFIKTFSFDTFKKWFLNVLTIICVISIVFFAVILINKGSFTETSFLYGTHLVSEYSIFYTDYSVFEAQNVFYNFSQRLQGPFWEPGVFGTVLLIGLFIEIAFCEKKNYYRIVIFLLTIFLTFSTGAYVTVTLVLLYGFFEWIYNKQSFSKKTKIIYIITALLLFTLAVILVVLLFKDKFFSSKGGSFLTRLYSGGFNIRVWFKNPIFGLGFKTARLTYNEITPSSITANTSTPFLLIAAFGIVGILYTVLPLIGATFDNRISATGLVIFIFFFILVLHQENNASLLAVSIFYGYIALDNIKFKWEQKEDSIIWKRTRFQEGRFCTEFNLYEKLNIIKNKKAFNNYFTKKYTKFSKFGRRTLLVGLATIFAGLSFISLSGISKTSTYDELYNISLKIKSNDESTFNGKIAELNGTIKHNNWLEFDKKIDTKISNKGVLFSVGTTELNNIEVNYSELNLNTINSSSNNKSLSFMFCDYKEFSDESIVLPRKLADKLFGVQSDYSKLSGKKVDIRNNDDSFTTKIISGVYEKNSNLEKNANNIYYNNFDYLIFVTKDASSGISSSSSFKYYMSLSGNYHANKAIYYSTFECGTKSLAYPDIVTNDHLFGDLSLAQYVDNYHKQGNKFRTMINISSIICVLSLLIFTYFIFIDTINHHDYFFYLILLFAFSLFGLLTIGLINRRVNIGSGFFSSILSNGWIWFVSITTSVSLVIFMFKIVTVLFPKVLSVFRKKAKGFSK